MRNLKKILALVLALVMSMSVMTVASADFKDQADVNEKYATAVNTLSALEVFKGYKDGSFNPKGTITRAEVAAIIYRIDTGDIYDKQVDIYKGYGKFADVAADAWYAGYVNYCANAEYVKGTSETTFDPNGKVTGYQALAMILRVVGYDQNNEFTGSEWQIQVASTAQSLGLLKNVDNSETLGQLAATRELVAELLWQAINVPQVDYTLAFGYSQYKNPLEKDVKNLTIEQEKIGLHYYNTADDIWGRPGAKVWATNKYEWNNWQKDTLGTYPVEPKEVYNEAITECNIVYLFGSKYDIKKDVWTNGVLQEDVTIHALYTNPNNDAHLIGEQGTIMEVYSDRIVLIDTYLTQVVDTIEEKTDKKGHIIVEAENYIGVYNEFTKDVNGKQVGEAYVLAGNNYATGEYLLVNVYEGPLTPADHAQLKANYIANGAEGYTVFIGENGNSVNPDEMNGKQTKIWWNAEKHTIEGETYMDNVNYILDAAEYDKDTEYRWFFDQFGFVIGSTDIPVEIEAKNYAVVLGAQWINSGKYGEYGYAYGTVQYLDGSEPTNAVLEAIYVDGKPVEFSYADTYKAEFSKGTVCTTYQYNQYNENTWAHLYEVVEGKTGLILKAVEPELKTATLLDGVSRIDDTEFYTDNETMYFFYNAKTGGLDVVKGYDNLPADYTASLVDIVYNANEFAAQFVYVPYYAPIDYSTTPDAKVAYGYYYITDDAMNYTLKNCFAIFGVVDVKGGTDPLLFSMNFAGNEEKTERYLDEIVEKYENTLIYVKTVDGLVTEITFITEAKLIKDVMTTAIVEVDGKDTIEYLPLTHTETAYADGFNAHLVTGNGTSLFLNGGENSEYEFIETGVLKCDVVKTLVNEDKTTTEYVEADGLNVNRNTVIINEGGVGTLSDMLALDGNDLYVVYDANLFAIAVFIIPAPIV